MAHALIAHKVAAMAALEERAKKLRHIREKNNAFRKAAAGVKEILADTTLNNDGINGTTYDGDATSNLVTSTTFEHVGTNEANTASAGFAKSKTLPPVRSQVKLVLHALSTDETKDPSKLTVGDVFKAIESLRSKRLQTLSDRKTSDKCKVRLVSAGDESCSLEEDRTSSTTSEIRKSDLTMLKKETFKYADVEHENKLQWKEKTRNIAGREDGVSVWKSDSDHSVNAVYTNHDCVFLGLGSGKIVILSPTGELRLTIVGHTGYISALTGFGQLLFSGSLDGTVRLWIYHKGEQMAMSAGHIGPVHCLYYQHKHRTLFSGSSDRSIRKWGLTEGKSEVLIRFDKGEGVFSMDEGLRNILVVGLETGVISFVDINSGVSTRSLEGHTDIVASVNVHRESKTVVSGSRDGTCRVWFAGRTSIVYTKHKDAVYKVKLVQNGQQCISCSGDQSIHRWNIVDGTCISIYLGHTGTIFAFDFCHGNMYSGDRTCRLLKWHAAVQCEFCEPKCGIGCKFRFVRCPHELCGIEISEFDLNSHVMECPKRLIKCRNRECKYNVRADAMNIHIKKNCLYTYVPCPNFQYCQQRVQRMHLANHLSFCNENNVKTVDVKDDDKQNKEVVTSTTVFDMKLGAKDEVKKMTDFVVKNVKDIPNIEKKAAANKGSKGALPKIKSTRRTSLPRKRKELPRVWRPGK